ncbi:hypothetical protein BKH31_12150 [Actinomyces oris]|uniref:HTH lacI-type domain-containing protein n=1 Tax=Actinomyces oris TaxID=544580 RepID=A0A1Q8V6B4_9ACTO|nr:LacI family DNA-binding transcriptional regulator [Actinomyces oris]OLO43636.1 hypothetical protein BKH31_12150 [Actinomyces oris]
MVTQRDIARELGVAVSTVSRSLSDVPGIPETTKERVRQAAERLGYRRDAHAASLRTGRSGTISLVVGAIDNPFFAELAHHVETQANRLGLLLMIANGQEDPQAQERVALSMLEQRVDGMILVPVGPPTSGLQELVAQTPTVAVDRLLPGAGVDSVLVDPRDAVRELVGHLRDAGYQRPAVISGPDATSTGAGRARVVAEELEAAGWSGFPVLSSAHDASQAQEVAERLLADRQPDVLICGGNVITLGVLHAMKRLGVEVGADVGVATFDDLPWFDLMNPALTSISNDIPRMAAETVRLLLQRIENPDGALQKVIHEAWLSLRESTSGPRP